MKTRITDLLEIKHPVIQGAMAWVSFPPLVAAVSNAGGLGILGSAFMDPEQLKMKVKEIRKLTDKPFGVNFIPESQQIEELLDVVVEENVPVVSYGIGNPLRIIKRAKIQGFFAIPTVGSVKHVLKAEKDGANAVVVQGVVTGQVTGIRCRVLRNKLSDGFLELAKQKAPSREMMDFGRGKIRQAFVEGDEELGSLVCGQICGMIEDIPTCQELIQRIVSGAEGILELAKAKIQPS